MLYDCHGHIFMDGVSFREAAARHKNGPDEAAIRAALAALRDYGVGYFRDGGDPYGAGMLARSIAPEYGIEYSSCAFAIHKKGRYGGIVGFEWSDLKEYRALVEKAKEQGAQFIKLMYSGLIDFERYGEITGTPLERGEIRELVNIAHGEGFSVMAHVNGARAVLDAAECGTDSIEHGCYPDEECFAAMRENGAIWVPTLAAAEGFCGRAGYESGVPERILEAQLASVKKASEAGVKIACGSDSGAFGVPHGEGTASELRLLKKAGVPEESIEKACSELRERFSGRR